MKLAPLSSRFTALPTLKVAEKLLGCYLVRQWEEHELVVQIVETEAYVGEDDKACHAAAGKTRRNEIMYGPPGAAYVYFIYGMHYCLNLVTERDGFPGAVLIRACTPIQGIEAIRIRRPGRKDRELLSGPGRLCAGLAIDRNLNGTDLTSPTSPLFIAKGPPVPKNKVETSSRVGISKSAGEARGYPWRFFIRGDPHVSPGRPTVR